MWSYHETRKQRTDCLAPQITVQSQLLPVRDRAKLASTSNCAIEVITLATHLSGEDVLPNFLICNVHKKQNVQFSKELLILDLITYSRN